MAAASLLGGTCRFLVMRYWVFGVERSSTTSSRSDAPPVLRT